MIPYMCGPKEERKVNTMTIYEYFTAEYNRTAPEAWDEIEELENCMFWAYENAPSEYRALAVTLGVDPLAPVM